MERPPSPEEPPTGLPPGSGERAAGDERPAGERDAESDADEFARELAESGLVDAPAVDLARQQLSERGMPSSAAALAHELVKSGKLTAYQAAAVLQGKIKGLVIGGYTVLDKLGSGSMGIVFKAIHRQLGQVVALKLLPPSLARHPTAVSRFRREAKAAAKLSHPNIVAVIDADEFRGLHFLVMEYVDGRDLSRLVREQGTLSIPQALDCIIQVARGLEAAFAAAVVHRDIKPSNLMADPGGTVKILDMGLARLDPIGGSLGDAEVEGSLTQSNALIGTVDYMAPEQASNPKNADHRSDIYSLGCTLFYLLTGRPPFTGETLIERLIAHREQPVPRLSVIRPDVPAELDLVVERMLAKSPADRFASLGELIAELEAFRAGSSLLAGVRPPLSLTGAGRGRARGSSWKPAMGKIAALAAPRDRRILIAAVVAVAAGALGLLFTGIQLGRGGAAHNQSRVGPITAAVQPPEANPAPQAAPAPTPDNENGAAELRVPSQSEVKVDRAPPATVAVPAPASARPAPPVEPIGLVRVFKGHTGRVNSVAVSHSGALALSGGQDRTVRLWDVATGMERRRVEHAGAVQSVALSADGGLGLSGSDDKTVRLWDFRAGHNLGVRQLDGHEGAVFAVTFARGDRLALSGGADGTVRAWDVGTGRPDGPPLLHDSAVVSLATSAGDSSSVLAGCADGTIWLWDLKSRERVRRLSAPRPVLCVACSPQSHRALSGHPDGLVVLWDLDLGAETGRLTEGTDYVRSAAFLAGGRRVLCGSQYGSLILWNLESSSAVYRFSPDSAGSAHAGQLGIAVGIDRVHALTGETDGSVRLWRLPDDGTQVPDLRTRGGTP
jgi:eukaryotic-like serine/threonine-protein kinase